MSLEKPSTRILRLPSDDVADCVLLLKKCDQVVYIRGSVCLRKVAGTLSIHGHNITDDKWYPACSSGTTLVTLECNSRRPIKYNSKILNHIIDDKTKKTIKNKWKKSNDIGCVVFLKENRLLSGLQSTDLLDACSVNDTEDVQLDQQELQSKTAHLGFTLFFDLPNAFSSLIVSPSWKSITELIESYRKETDARCPVVLICGAKNVGKSTFARYLMNTLLNTDKPLCYLETDVGQSEFTPPGVLSLNKVDQPIFGPPFFHLAKPERAFFFGDISPKDHPSTYVQLIYVLYQHYIENCRDMPLVVNTCGWVKGMGVRILLDVIRIVQPSHIVQINSESQPTKNLPELTEDFLLSEEGWIYEFNERKTCPRIYQTDAFVNHVEMTKGLGLQASELRSLSLLSYFGSNHSISSGTSIQEYIIKNSTVYSVPLTDLKVCSAIDDVSPEHILHSIIGSVVGLIRNDEKKAAFTHVIDNQSLPLDNVQFGEHVGLGIVRNIDTSKQILYIITPEPLAVLNTVQALVKGRLEILDCLYKKQPFGKLPFVTSEFTYNHRGSGQKRIRYNLLRQRSPYSRKDNVKNTNSST